MAHIIDFDGHLAIDLGWVTSWSKPQRERRIYVGRVRTEQYSNLLGREVHFTGNTGVVHWYERRYVFQTDDRAEWTPVDQEQTIRKPRKRRTHDWKWEHGRWIADYGRT